MNDLSGFVQEDERLDGLHGDVYDFFGIERFVLFE